MKDILEMFNVFDFDILEDWLEETEALRREGKGYKKIKAYLRTQDPLWTGKMLWEFEYCLKVRRENTIIQRETESQEKDSNEKVLFVQRGNILIDKHRHEVGVKIPGEDSWDGKNRVWFLPKHKGGRPKIKIPLNHIKARHLQGASTRAIAKELNISKSTVATILKKGNSTAGLVGFYHAI